MSHNDTHAPDTDAAAPPARAWPRWAALAGVAALAAVTAVCGWQWHSSTTELDAVRARDGDREAVAKVASDYATRSLSYDFRDLDAFFAGVTDGVDAPLRDRYQQVRGTLAQIMTEAQVVATGTVVATAAEPDGPGRYKVTVFATQHTRNAGSPEPSTVPNLLTVTVAEHDNRWQVTDYGAESG
ncbi:hypothetical protein [Nocardia wallacei]|uniref:hypothetical protein n=1 Tax=Nocardia wallacei TaxID=480035 RepID=UPI002453F48C|nr:hypothetical protein [Nocardia wallacei]